MKLCIYCAGGYGKEVYDIATRINRIECRWSEIFFTDDTKEDGSKYYNANLLSFANIVEKMAVGKVEFTIANGEPAVREKLYKKVIAKGYSTTTLIDPSALIAPTSVIKDGAVIGPKATVSSDAHIDVNVAINVGGIVGHDISIGKNSVLSSYCNIGGASKIGSNSYIGMGSMIKEKSNVGNDVIIGMGSVVHNDIPDGVIALGNPARPMRPNINKKVFK